jgi:phosphopantothenoylcysteine synthetase/decarboxylase
MTNLNVIYLIVCGAASARLVPDLLRALAQFELPIYTLLTESAQQIISPYHLADQQGHSLIDSYFDPALLNGRAAGVTVVAPATFNTLNKMSQGLADNLPLSLAAEALGAGWPVIVAPSMNPALANHPQLAKSLATLRAWSVTIVEPHPEGQLLLMASVEEIVDAVRRGLASANRRKDE